MSGKGKRASPFTGRSNSPGIGSAANAARALLVQADQLCRSSRLAEAEQLVRRALSLNPRDHAALHMLGLIRYRAGDHSGAIELYRQAIDLNGRVAAYHGNLGNAYLEAQSPEPGPAVECFRRALALEPGSVLARFGLGLALLGRRDHRAAARELEAASDARPDHADTHLNLAIALTEIGQLDEAIAHCQRAIALNPGFARNHLRLGMALGAKGELKSAHAHLARALELDPELIEAYEQLAVLYRALGREGEAMHALHRALTLRPETVDGLRQLGGIHCELRRFDEALECYERGLAIDPRCAALYRGIGRVRFMQGRLEAARAALSQALELEPDNAANYAAMGRSYQTEGRFQEAIAWQEKAIARDPNNVEAHYTLSMMHSSADREGRIRELEHALQGESLTTDKIVGLNFSLGKLYDEDGNPDAAFRCFKTGNDLRKARQQFPIEEHSAFIERQIAMFSREFFAEMGLVGSDSDRPVFVVGMMRSGTTLVEQILATHPDIYGHGELDDIHALTQAIEEQVDGRPSFPECVAGLNAEMAQTLAAGHIARLERDAGATARSVDKMPNNFKYLGLIALLFPRARLIHCVRDPRDTCLSSYFQDFGIRHGFTCDLAQLGRYHRLYQRLMAHWHAVLPMPILDVPYEQLVADQETWSRKIIDFVGLPWDARCLDYHKTDRPVLTSSFWQVRQPIYTTSIGRWRPYEKHLGPLLEALGSSARDGMTNAAQTVSPSNDPSANPAATQSCD